jgi:hypothetical protein
MLDNTRASPLVLRRLRAEGREMRRRMRRAQPHAYQALLVLTAAIRNPSDLEPEELANCVRAERCVASALAAISDVPFFRTFVGLRPRWHFSNLERDLVPPIGACFLLALTLRKADREVIPDDLVEEFATSILLKYGPRRARFWFWTQTVSTIASRNPACRWVLVVGLARLIEWLSGR